MRWLKVLGAIALLAVLVVAGFFVWLVLLSRCTPFGPMWGC
jgi:hypothetical protein